MKHGTITIETGIPIPPPTSTMIFPISHDINTTIHLPEIMRSCQQQHGLDGLVGSIIEYCCENNSFDFEDKLIAALVKFKAENQ